MNKRMEQESFIHPFRCKIDKGLHEKATDVNLAHEFAGLSINARQVLEHPISDTLFIMVRDIGISIGRVFFIRFLNER